MGIVMGTPHTVSMAVAPVVILNKQIAALIQRHSVSKSTANMIAQPVRVTLIVQTRGPLNALMENVRLVTRSMTRGVKIRALSAK
jgi:cation transport ATPase